MKNCVMNISNTDTEENIGQIENITEVNITSESQTNYIRDKHNNTVSRFKHDTTYTLTFNTDTPINKEKFVKTLGIDTSNIPDVYNVQFLKIVQACKHKKKRINKKWLKRYGLKLLIVEGKGWKIHNDTDGNVQFIK